MARQRDRLRDAYLSGTDSLEEYRDAKEATQQKLTEISMQIEEAEEKNAVSGTSCAAEESAKTALKTLRCDAAGVEQAYEAAHAIINYATWDKAKNLLCIHSRLTF